MERKLYRLFLIEADEQGQFPPIPVEQQTTIMQIMEVERTREQAEDIFFAAARRAGRQ